MGWERRTHFSRGSLGRSGESGNHATAGGGSRPCVSVRDDTSRKAGEVRRVQRVAQQCAGDTSFHGRELAQLAREVPGAVVEQEFFDTSNWVIVILKA